MFRQMFHLFDSTCGILILSTNRIYRFVGTGRALSVFQKEFDRRRRCNKPAFIFCFDYVLCTLYSALSFMATIAAAEPFHRHCERSECRHNCRKSEKFADSFSSLSSSFPLEDGEMGENSPFDARKWRNNKNENLSRFSFLFLSSFRSHRQQQQNFLAFSSGYRLLYVFTLHFVLSTLYFYCGQV
jgi:hypothetical protein